MKAGSQEWLAAKASGPVWQYQDARGITHTGYMGTYHDFGGSDHTAQFYDATTGELSMVSGSRLKSAKRI